MLHFDGDDLVVHLSVAQRLGVAYAGSAPRIAVSEIAWVAAFPPLDLVGISRLVRLHWLTFSNRGLVYNFTDPRAASILDDGPAFVYRRMGWDSLVVKSLESTPWSELVVSTKSAPAIVSAIVQRNPRVSIREHL